jgi:hypothetical protein
VWETPCASSFPEIFRERDEEAAMTLRDDEILAEEALGETDGSSRQQEGTHYPPAEMPSSVIPLESGMETGQGADDEPELAIGDRHISDAERVSPEEARRLLGGEDG